MPKRLPYRSFTTWLILAVLLTILIAAESFALYTTFTTKFPSGNDFFVRWLGGREYLLHGTNPFDPSIAEQAQRAMFGRLARPADKDQAYFAYPLYTLYFFWPLSLVSYAWAQAIWMTLLQFMLLGSTLLAIRLAGWHPPKWLFVVTILWGIFFYNGARAILLGQFSILVGLTLFLALWFIKNRQDEWAGIFLSITTIKPQMVFLVLLFLLIWALFQQRWRLIGSFIISLLFLGGSSILLVPTWPFDFVRNAIAYSDYVAFGTPLENLLQYVLPETLATLLTVLLSMLLFVALLPGWWLAFQGRPGGYTWAVLSTLIVGSLITFRSATTNQVILYLPLFFFFRRLSLTPKPNISTLAGGFARTGRWSLKTRVADLLRANSNVIAVLSEASLLLLMWGVFVATLEGNWENVMMHGLFPALMLLLYVIDWHALWYTAIEFEVKNFQDQSAALKGRSLLQPEQVL